MHPRLLITDRLQTETDDEGAWQARICKKTSWLFIFRETFLSKIMISGRRLTICHLRISLFFLFDVESS